MKSTPADLIKLGERLRIARSNAGLKQELAAKALDMSRSTLVAVEQGQRKLKPDELIKIASLYKVSVNELLRKTATPLDLTGKFRRTSQNSKLEDASQEALKLLSKLAGSSLELENRLNQRHSFVAFPERPILPGSLDEQAEDLAMDIRHRLGIGLAPVGDIVSLVELEFGVRIFFRPLNSAISGVYAYDKNVGPCILINSLHSRERQILTIVHELGHFFCNREAVDVFGAGSLDDSREEKFVTLFSIAFLMPAVLIRKKFRELASSGSFTPRHLLLLAHAFGVSFEAICRRLEYLSLLPNGTFESLKERGFEIEATREKLGLGIRQEVQTSPPRLTLLAVDAYKKGLLSEGQIGDLLALDRVRVREQLDLFGSDETDDEISINS